MKLKFLYLLNWLNGLRRGLRQYVMWFRRSIAKYDIFKKSKNGITLKLIEIKFWDQQKVNETSSMLLRLNFA